MKDSCTILIPHVNTPHLLYGSIEQIERLTTNIEWEVVVADQSKDSIYKDVAAKYCSHNKVKVIKLAKIDAGYPIDMACRASTKEFFCSLDVDAFPIHKNWLYAPIELIKEFKLSFVGQDTGLSQFPDYKAHGNFSHINNYFRVSRTDVAKKLSEEAGFCRVQNQDRTNLKYKKCGWNADHSDNGVLAQWYSDKLGCGDKLSLALNKILGMTKEFGVYGMCIDDLVFHFVFGYHPDTIADANKSLGKDYLDLEAKICKEGLTQSNVDELVSRLKNHHPYTSRTISIGGVSNKLGIEHEVYVRLDQLKEREVK